MNTFKEVMRKVFKQVWDLVKMSFPAFLIYCCCGSILQMLTLKDESSLTWDNTKLLWTIVLWLGAIAYNAFVSYAQGGMGYEMLVSGNRKRKSMADGVGYKMSNHKEEKEYRVWRGFATGALTGIGILIFGLIFGANGEEINKVFTPEGSSGNTGLGLLVLGGFFISGLTVLPWFYLNGTGYAVSYYFTMLFALIPILVTGFLYIAGAYGKRNKTLRAQEEAAAKARAEAAKPVKINYGGLPGTKPNKRK